MKMVPGRRELPSYFPPRTKKDLASSVYDYSVINKEYVKTYIFTIPGPTPPFSCLDRRHHPRAQIQKMESKGLDPCPDHPPAIYWQELDFHIPVRLANLVSLQPRH